MIRFLSVIVATIGTLAIATEASAGFIFTAGQPGSAHSARAEFSVVNFTLIVDLYNTGGDATLGSDVLTAVFFNANATLTPLSATVIPGSSIIYQEYNNNGSGGNQGTVNYQTGTITNVGGEFAYRSRLTFLNNLETYNSGISSAGLGLFTNANFRGPNLQNPVGLEGVQYGIVSKSDILSTASGGLDQNAMIKGGVEFKFLIANPSRFILDTNSVLFQYGTSRTDPSITGHLAPVPEPSSMALFGLGSVAALCACRQRRCWKLVAV